MRYKTKLITNSPDWRQQAELELVRTAFKSGIVDLELNTSSPAFSDLLFLDLKLEADAPNSTDRLGTAYSASLSFPKGNWDSLDRRVNCAQTVTEKIAIGQFEEWRRTVRHETVDLPSKEELEELRRSVQLLAAAIRYVRSAAH